MNDATSLKEQLQRLSEEAAALSQKTEVLEAQLATAGHGGVDPLMFGLFVFVLACFVGYYVVWKVTPALHTPLMAVTNAISGIIVVGAMVAVGAEASGMSATLGFFAVLLASINIFGGFVVTQRMLEMFKKKEAKK
ncbi:MAG: NAD synthetase [Rickettsiales bacterium]|nr:NAD synthetase [Rickettsiales bacterium]|tara:strand:- start:969 stop:1376 length:408 start_codon:yes stop_codon:yes gene_type:complete